MTKKKAQVIRTPELVLYRYTHRRANVDEDGDGGEERDLWLAFFPDHLAPVACCLINDNGCDGCVEWIHQYDPSPLYTDEIAKALVEYYEDLYPQHSAPAFWDAVHEVLRLRRTIGGGTSTDQ